MAVERLGGQEKSNEEKRKERVGTGVKSGVNQAVDNEVKVVVGRAKVVDR